MNAKALIAGLLGAVLAGGVSHALEKVTFGTNWVAQAEHGGFYQAVADGTYAACGIDVEIVPGGPNVNNRALLLAGKIDYLMGGNLLQAFNAVKQGVPFKVLASIFQKEPQIIMTHPNQGFDTWESLKSTPTLFIGNGGYESFYKWMVNVGFSLEQRKPYTYNAAPFLADKKSGQQGYVTSEPFVIARQGGFKPNVFLLADYGFDTYSTTIEAMDRTINEREAVTRCFVEGSIIGWTKYLYGDRSAADALILAANPEMRQELLDFSVEQMKAFGIVDSGDSLTMGIGAIRPERIKSFFDKMVDAKVVDAGIDYTRSYDLRFINKGVGLDIKKKLTAQ